METKQIQATEKTEAGQNEDHLRSHCKVWVKYKECDNFIQRYGYKQKN